MIYTPLTVKAINTAYRAHAGQTDKSGLPYIFHPYHVAEQMTDELSVCAAVLHDVVEDTDLTIEMLAMEFPEEVVEAVRLLTHEPDIPYLKYVENLKENPIARKVKLADLEHNTDESRTAGICTESEADRQRRREKYAKAKEILLNK